MTDILIFGGIYTFQAEFFYDQIAKALANGDKELEVVINSGGGNPTAGWSMIAKAINTKEIKSVKVAGDAHSMAAFFLLYVDNVTGVDTSQYLIHRAAYSSYYEAQPEFRDSLEFQQLQDINEKVKSAFVAKIDVAKFESLDKMNGKTVESIFSLDSREEVLLNAQEAKEIGLIDQIETITPQAAAEVNGMYERFKGATSLEEFKIAASAKPIIKSKNKKMTVDELKANHPEVYDAVKNAGKTEEQDRVSAWAEFSDIDADAVKAGIQSGKNMSQLDMAKFTRKALKLQAAKDAEEESPKEVTTDQPKDAPEANAEDAKFLAEIDAEIKKQAGK